MQVKATDGHWHDISHEEAVRIHAEMSKIMPGIKQNHHAGHNFTIGGQKLTLTPEEMKTVADAWWDNYGKSAMQNFFEEYQKKAAGNIRCALGFCNDPKDEKEVKSAISLALASNDPELAAEVIFEAAEWETAYSGLKSISG